MEQRYYFDANALVKYYHPFLKHNQEEEGILQIRRLVFNFTINLARINR